MYGPEAVCRSHVPLLAEMLPHMGLKMPKPESMLIGAKRNPRPELGETLEAMVLSEPGKSTKGCGSGMWAQCASGPVQYRFNLQLSQMRGLRSDVQSLLGVLAKLFRPVQMPMKPHHMHPGKSAML